MDPSRLIGNGGIGVYYSAGLAGMSAFGATVALPHNGTLWLLARLLLDAAGACFGLYLMIAFGLSTAGQVMRFRRRVTVADMGGRKLASAPDHGPACR
jgi:hypothetical protein